jgi:glutathione S-transferase
MQNTIVPMKFYTANICPFASRTHITLIECFSPEQLQQIQLFEIDLTNKPEWYAQIHPQLKVPALQIEDRILIESLAISEYILEVYGQHTQLLPHDPFGRYEMRTFIEQFTSMVLPPFYGLLRAQNAQDQQKSQKCLLEGIKQVSKRIKGPFVLGNQFTFADIATIPWPLRFDALEHYRGFNIPNEPEYAVFRAWVQACLKRKSVEVNVPTDGSVAGYKRYAEGRKETK